LRTSVNSPENPKPVAVSAPSKMGSKTKCWSSARTTVVRPRPVAGAVVAGGRGAAVETAAAEGSVLASDAVSVTDAASRVAGSAISGLVIV
jgi:hypothetical protein